MFATFRIKTPYSFDSRYRSAGSAAPPKIGIVPEPVQLSVRGRNLLFAFVKCFGAFAPAWTPPPTSLVSERHIQPGG